MFPRIILPFVQAPIINMKYGFLQGLFLFHLSGLTALFLAEILWLSTGNARCQLMADLWGTFHNSGCPAQLVGNILGILVHLLCSSILCGFEKFINQYPCIIQNFSTPCCFNNSAFLQPDICPHSCFITLRGLLRFHG